ncbi:MAG: polyprenyl synthetase family protein [Candidatus Eremiobacteraeota bacterium]|nr:polyprenyl synthetase family protein [Candidatus Eremiobacteraeota bacterium]
MRRGWRRSPVKPSERLEATLERAIGEQPADTLVGEMLAYHFGYTQGDAPRRGKRLRPRLLFTVAEEAGASVDDAVDGAVAVELLHNYSLIHDDIEDADRYRHGRETLWAKYGIAQAINAGDALCALSFLALLKGARRFPAERMTLMVQRLHLAHLAMCHGQSLDIAFESMGDVPSARYLEMISGKTAALFAVSAELGALCAGLREEEVRRYRELGAAFGVAFQMYDDLLGIWADARATGKTPGADIARRKKTFPVVWALEQPQSPQRGLIAQAYEGEGELSAAAVSEISAVLDAMGARQAARLAAAKHLAVVERAPSGRVRDFLLSLLPVAAPT